MCNFSHFQLHILIIFGILFFRCSSSPVSLTFCFHFYCLILFYFILISLIFLFIFPLIFKLIFVLVCFHFFTIFLNFSCINFCSLSENFEAEDQKSEEQAVASRTILLL